MSTDSFFVPLARAGAPAVASVEVTLNGEKVLLPGSASVAASLLAGGVKRFRKSPVSGAGRAPYCMMGVCFECLLEIDGVPNRQACLIPIKPGMNIRTQDTLPDCPANYSVNYSADHDSSALSQSLSLSLAQVMEASHGK